MTKAIYLAIILFCLRCLISWNSIISSFSLYNIWGYIGEAIGITTIIMALYEKWLWRLNKFEDLPLLKKKYNGKLKSSYDKIERDAQLVINQTLLSIHVILISNESKSKSISASIDDILGEKQLTYCYLNTPKVEFRNRSEIHYGTAMLSIANSDILIGQYFTDRCTRGDMEFIAEEVSNKTITIKDELLSK